MPEMLRTEYSVDSLAGTRNQAAVIGSRLRGGEVIQLLSDIGGGKTSFVRGLVKGAGSRDVVSSPSFTLSNQYLADSLVIYHFDFYRLSEPGIMSAELAEVLTQPDAVIIVEWADIVEGILPKDHISIKIEVTGATKRRFRIEYSERYNYLFEADNS